MPEIGEGIRLTFFKGLMTADMAASRSGGQLHT